MSPGRTPTASSRGAWLIWGAAAFAYLVSISQRTTFGVAGLQATERFHASASILATFSVVQLVVYAGMQIPVGALTDRLGSRRMIATGAALMATGQAVLAFATSTPLGFVGRVLVGAGDAMTFISVLRLLPAFFPPRVNPLLSQITAGIGQMGQIVSLVPFAALLGLVGWTPTFIGMSALSVLAFLLAVLFVRSAPRRGQAQPLAPAEPLEEPAEQPTKQGEPAEQEQGPGPGAGAGTGADVPAMSLARAIRRAWSHPGTRLAFWTHWISAFGVNVFLLGWGYPFLVSGQGLAQGTASVLMALFVLVSIVFGPLVGLAVARFPLRRSNVTLLVVGAGMLAWILAIGWPGRAPLWVLVLMCLCIAAGGPASMIAFDYARTENPPELIGAATGLANVGSFSGGLLAIWGVGFVLDLARDVGGGSAELYALSGFRLAFLVVLAVYAAGLTGFLVERARTRRERVRRGHAPIQPLHRVVARVLRPAPPARPAPPGRRDSTS